MHMMLSCQCTLLHDMVCLPGRLELVSELALGTVSINSMMSCLAGWPGLDVYIV